MILLPLLPLINCVESESLKSKNEVRITTQVSLVREIASAISDEARAAFNHAGRPSLTCMSPNLNVARDPRWGRSLESFGEDPDLIATLARAYIDGIQHGIAPAPQTQCVMFFP